MYIELIKEFELLNDKARYQKIITWLEKEKIPFWIHEYESGKNIIIPSEKSNKVAVGSHYDTVLNTAGANDNLSSVITCLYLAKKIHEKPLDSLGVEIYIFDEEEIGLKGSKAYLRDHGLRNISGYLNLEMVGMGNQFALWPLNELSNGTLLKIFESVSKSQNIKTGRFDKIVMNTADHQSFRLSGLEDSFSLTCISDRDVEVAIDYYRALFDGADRRVLEEIFSAAPIFEHYHQPTDRSIHLSELTIDMAIRMIWLTLQELDTTSERSRQQ